MAPPAWAGEAGEEAALESISLEALLDLEVVSATRSESKLSESPVPISVITANEIANSGLDSMPDILAKLAEVDVLRIGRSQTEVSIRGKGINFNRRMLVLIDGRTEYNDLLGVTFWHAFPISVDDIERIEVVRGPASALFGANAYSGVINIITKAATGETGAAVRAHQGDFNRRYYSAQGRIGGESFGVKLSGGKQGLESDGTHVEFPGFNRIPTTSNFFEDDESLDDVERANAQAVYKFGERSDVKLSIGGSSGTFEFIPQPGLPREKWDIDSEYVHFIANVGFGESANFQLNAYRNTFEYETPLVPTTDDVDALDRSDGRFYFPAVVRATDFSGTVATSDVTLQFTGNAFDGAMNWVAGAEYREIDNSGADPVTDARCTAPAANVRRECGLVRDSSKDIKSYFGNFTYKFGESGWHAGLGFRSDDDSITGQDYGYNASVTYFLNERDNIRATARRAFRAPSLFEQFSNVDLTVPKKNQRVRFRGNPQAGVETIESQDVTWTFFAGEKAQFTVEYFQEKYKEIIGNPDTGLLENIEVDPVTNIFTTTTKFENLADAKSSGVQLGVLWLARENLTVYANYRYTDPKALNSVPGETFFSPEDKFNAGLNWQFGEFSLDTAWQFVDITPKREFKEGNVAPDGPNFTRDNQDNYSTVNLAMHYRSERLKGLDVYLAVDNALDEERVEYFEYDEVLKAAGESFGRSVWGGFSWKF